jgi:multisubunit Na+/H+ antiporter MnhB subunit
MAAIGFAIAGPVGVAGIFIAGTVLYLLLKPRQPWEDDPWRRN